MASLSTGAIANDIYVQHNIDTHATEVGANLDVTDFGTSVFLGGDDAGWRAAGIGQTIEIGKGFSVKGYYEHGIWNGSSFESNEEFDTWSENQGHENIFEVSLSYKKDNYGLIAGLGYVDAKDKTTTNTTRYDSKELDRDGLFRSQRSDLSNLDYSKNKLFLGGDIAIKSLNLSYNFTHENVDVKGNFNEVRNSWNGSETKVTNSPVRDEFRTNEHEFVISYNYEQFTPYVKYTHFVANGDYTTDEVVIGTSYSF